MFFIGNFWERVKAFGVGFIAGIVALGVGILAVMVRGKNGSVGRITDELGGKEKRKEVEDVFIERAETKQRETEDVVFGCPARAVAERFEGVGDAVAEGRSRFAARTRKRILARRSGDSVE